MSHPAVAVLETALRARHLDRTLTTRLPPLERTEAAAAAPSAVAALDACLGGGLPRGELSEIVGPRSSGRTTLLVQMLTAATMRGEIAAVIDTFDSLDVASLVMAGVDLDRVLWVRGDAVAAGPPGSMAGAALFDRALERGVKALNLVLQAGGFGLVAIDLADAPAVALRRLPFTTWRRVQRAIEGRDTACVIVGAEPIGRSAGGLTLAMAGRTSWTGTSERSARLAGMDIAVTVISPRRRVGGEVAVDAMVVESTA